MFSFFSMYKKTFYHLLSNRAYISGLIQTGKMNLRIPTAREILQRLEKLLKLQKHFVRRRRRRRESYHQRLQFFVHIEDRSVSHFDFVL